ncbi:MAG TPA: ABC transporter permease [Bacillota bacterium]|nr:ABC transporter permease [Bacillota bacterium]
MGRGSRWLGVAVGAVCVFLLLPIVVVILTAFNAGSYLRFPPQGFSLRWFVSFAHNSTFTSSFLFSLELAALATALAAVLGTLGALFAVRHAGRWANALRLLMVAPLELPAILTGVALLIFFYGIRLRTQGLMTLLIGHTLICIPFVFLAVSVVLTHFDTNLEEAARSLGADGWRTFLRVTLPLIKVGIVSGATLAFVSSFGEFPISLLLSGVQATPLPLQLFDYLRFSFDPTAAAVGTVNIALTVSVVLLTERWVGLESLYRGGRR